MMCAGFEICLYQHPHGEEHGNGCLSHLALGSNPHPQSCGGGRVFEVSSAVSLPSLAFLPLCIWRGVERAGQQGEEVQECYLYAASGFCVCRKKGNAEIVLRLT